ncbi:MAG TPA: hypothetical protein VG943_14040 [Caulobacterales bacterium]|nr:hypothetical protein [Caulobacterales bacterium]
MLLVGLFALQLAVVGAGLFLIWRRTDVMRSEVERLRSDLAERSGVARTEKLAAPTGAPGATIVLAEWRRRLDREISALKLPPTEPVADVPPSLKPETARAMAVVCALLAPTIGLAFGAPLPAIVATAFVIAAATSLISLRDAWRDTAWFATIGGAAWAIAGFLAGVGGAHTPLFCYGLVIAASAGLLRARLSRPSTPGAALALVMAVTALAVGIQLGLVGPTGIAFGAIVAIAAAFGAASLRLEWIHLSAFLGAGAGLFVLSGQTGADVWFTPAAVWAGVWFWALAFVRVPELGPRGLLISATGAIAPLFAVSALYQARHGLETAPDAAAGFAVLALSFGAILSLSARRQKRLADLHLTLWALGIAMIGALSTAVMLVAPPPAYPSVLALLALGAIAMTTQWPDRFWSAAAASLALISVVTAWSFASAFNAPETPWSPLAIAILALSAPAALAGVAAYFAKPRAPIASGVLEFCAILGGVASLSAWTRLAFSQGAPALASISFVELGAHAALWLGAALLLAARAERGAKAVRNGVALLLTIAGVTLSFGCLALWLTPWWGPDLLTPPYLDPPLGFAAPAAALWAHWVYWRHVDDAKRARWTFGAAGVMSAAAITLELVWRRESVDTWLALLLGASAFALAAGLNFVPGLAVRQRKEELQPPTLTIVPPATAKTTPKKSRPVETSTQD